MGSIFGLALLAMFNPSLVAAVTLMLLLPEPKKLMFGYLLGAYLTSMTVGMLIVFSFHDSAGTEAAHNTISPAADLALGVILLIVGLVLRSERGERLKESRRTRKAAKGKAEGIDARTDAGKRLGADHLRRRRRPHLPRRVLPGGAPPHRRARRGHRPDRLGDHRLLSDHDDADRGALARILVAPERTAATVVRLRGWLAENGGRVGANVAIVLGAILVVRGLLTLHT